MVFCRYPHPSIPPCQVVTLDSSPQKPCVYKDAWGGGVEEVQVTVAARLLSESPFILRITGALARLLPGTGALTSLSAVLGILRDRL